MKRLRLVRRWKKPPRPAPLPKAPRPADLDNPYGPVYRPARAFAQLAPGGKG